MQVRARFIKIGYSRFIGHLDLMKIFHRAFKRAGINLKYSEGYNPTPRFSISNPLPLGVASECEYLEFESLDELDLESARKSINLQLPRGLEIKYMVEYKEYRSISRDIFYSKYALDLEGLVSNNELSLLCDKILEANEIIVKRKRKNKKTKRIEEVDFNIRPLLIDIKASEDKPIIEYTCHSSDGANLRADSIVNALAMFLNRDIDYTKVEVTRLNQFGEGFKELIIE